MSAVTREDAPDSLEAYASSRTMVPLARPLALSTLAVRWLHLLAATVVVGGSLTTWVVLFADRDTDRVEVVTVARSYEWLFWAAVGTLVMTGVGNLGAFAPTLPGGPWRATFDAKLGAFVFVLGGSALRTTFLSRVESEPAATTRRRLRRAYGATAAGFLVLLALAGVLAHG
jgi:putative copper export protein